VSIDSRIWVKFTTQLTSETMHPMGEQQDEGCPGLFWVKCLFPFLKIVQY